MACKSIKLTQSSLTTIILKIFSIKSRPKNSLGKDYNQLKFVLLHLEPIIFSSIFTEVDLWLVYFPIVILFGSWDLGKANSAGGGSTIPKPGQSKMPLELSPQLCVRALLWTVMRSWTSGPRNRWLQELFSTRQCRECVQGNTADNREGNPERGGDTNIKSERTSLSQRQTFKIA